jgi:signal transduction histidine kinase/ActR/RegA family two-component response regulator
MVPMVRHAADEPDAPRPIRGAALPIAILPFPVLQLDAAGTVLTSNGMLERELALPEDALRSRPLAEAVAEGSRARLADVLADHGSARDTLLQLSFAGAARDVGRTFYLLRGRDASWLIGQPAEMDIQRETAARARQRAEANDGDRARVNAELRRANEQLAQRSQQLDEATHAKARFLTTMSHELRTPLNAVLGYAGLLRDGVYGAMSEQQERAVQAIVRRSHDLQTLIGDVLDLSNIEAGRLELRIDDFDPARVVSEVTQEIAPLARDRELNLTVRDRMRGPVRLDRGKYKRAVTNLVSNAIKFTPQHGEIEISVAEQSGTHFITRVRDTGIGIEKERLPHIFETFEQADAGTTRRYGGIGLGLALVQRTVELLGGTIAVESRPDEGTTFVVTLPLRPERDALAGIIEESAADSASMKPLVLAIDDDPEVIGLVRDSLVPEGYRVVGALSGTRGLELARILQPFAITLDVMMPDKDGWHVLRELKADASVRRIPVIMMSIVAERAAAFSLGVTDYLVKPVDRQVLLDVLGRLRRKSRGRRAATHPPPAASRPAGSPGADARG